MRPEERRKLTWEDATERFLDVAELKPGERPKGWEEACDKLTWNAFNSISGARLRLAQDVLESLCCPPEEEPALARGCSRGACGPRARTGFVQAPLRCTVCASEYGAPDPFCCAPHECSRLGMSVLAVAFS